MGNDKSAVLLSNETLETLSDKLAVPQYDRGEVTPGMVHFGVGGFHRAHQAYYLDQLMNMGKCLDWGIVGAGLLPGDEAMKQALSAQDYLYTLVSKNANGSWDSRIIGSIIDYLYGPDDPQALVEQLADPQIRIVSMTITEGGYNFDQITGEFIATTPAVQADLAEGALPSTVFGYVYEGLKLRKERGIAPFTVMSCDNIQENGVAAKKAILAFARLKDGEMATWMEQNVNFPSSMVDRITPRTSPEDIQAVYDHYGIKDGWPVVTEPFIQWVLEDEFNCGRPAYEEVGVQLVEDVEPYELMKLRLLNVSHQALAYYAWLMGYRFVHDAAKDPLIAEFLMGYMNQDATPTLSPLPGIDLDEYKKSLIERFSNAEVCDTVARLAAETSDRIPKWLMPIIAYQLQTGGDVKYAAAIVASWARYAEGVDEQGEPIDVVDNAKEQVMAAAAKQKDDSLAFLRQEAFFGNLVNEPEFTKEYLWALDSLHEVGAKETLSRLLAK
ncbi:mannitol 2-dehydrogenase [Lachnospiraceae bacterium PM6-15]|uniref:mannitol dehydrogenase family protein n=1 Tax=Ohessyouella blattaphilus TaxID=2949333 RepID=UPI003E1EF099